MSEMPVSFRDHLDARAKAEGRSRSELIYVACLYYLKYAQTTQAEPALPPPPNGKRGKGRPRKKSPSI